MIQYRCNVTGKKLTPEEVSKNLELQVKWLAENQQWPHQVLQIAGIEHFSESYIEMIPKWLDRRKAIYEEAVRKASHAAESECRPFFSKLKAVK